MAETFIWKEHQTPDQPQETVSIMDVPVAASANVDATEHAACVTPAQTACAARASNAPVSDLDIAAQYADMDIQTVAMQFESTRMVDEQNAMVDEESDASSSEEEEEDAPLAESNDANKENVAMKETEVPQEEEEPEEEEEEDDEDREKLRAEIEAAMEKEESASGGPLKTANEVTQLPVREPSVELTKDCPIAKCGSILNVSAPGLMITVKSDPNAKPLDEGSVFCFEDRTVIGCVDEVFGPVLMPMYLVRYETADKMPSQATAGQSVFYATEHVSYIVPEQIKDKGTDASNIFDEETDEAVYSDDEAEAAAKRQNRKRHRNQNQARESTHTPSASGVFTDYHQGGRGGRVYGGGPGGGRGGRGGYAPPNAAMYSNAPPMQHPPYHQPQYHQPQYRQPQYAGQMHMQPPMLPYPPQQHYQHPQHRQLPPYPPQAPPPPSQQMYYQHPQQHYQRPPQGAYYNQGYAPPPPPQHQQYHGHPPHQPPPPPPYA